MKLVVIIDCIDGYNRVFFFFLRAFMAQFETAFVLFVVGNFSVVTTSLELSDLMERWGTDCRRWRWGGMCFRQWQ